MVINFTEPFICTALIGELSEINLLYVQIIYLKVDISEINMTSNFTVPDFTCEAALGLIGRLENLSKDIVDFLGSLKSNKLIFIEFLRNAEQFSSWSAMNEIKELLKVVKKLMTLKNNHIDKTKENSQMFLKRKKELKKIKGEIESITDNSRLNELCAKPIECEPVLPKNDINLNDDERTASGLEKNTVKICGNNNLQNLLNDFTKAQYHYSNCHICKKNHIKSHFFYGSMCPSCGDFNFKFRNMDCDLTNCTAIVTGGRVKIGYEIVLKLLRSNCTVIVTSRFPKDALNRYTKESDFENFKDRLRIYPLDLRFTSSLKSFLQYVHSEYDHIDILINNAAQTNRRPATYYEYLLQIESEPLPESLEKIIIDEKKYESHCKTLSDKEDCLSLDNNSLNLIPNLKADPLPKSVLASQIKLMKLDTSTCDIKENAKIFDANNQPIDFSSKYTWNKQIDEVNFEEFAEVQLINSWSPFILCSQLKPLLMKSPNKDRFIVNVTAVEGIFNHFKRSTHPHTNMAKASLNMLTLTISSYYKESSIYVTCVDTGWVTQMNEFHNLLNNDISVVNEFENQYISTPLDEVDGAMRVLHPVFEGITNKKYMDGVLLKDYKVHNW